MHPRKVAHSHAPPSPPMERVLRVATPRIQASVHTSRRACLHPTFSGFETHQHPRFPPPPNRLGIGCLFLPTGGDAWQCTTTPKITLAFGGFLIIFVLLLALFLQHWDSCFVCCRRFVRYFKLVMSWFSADRTGSWLDSKWNFGDCLCLAMSLSSVM